MSSKIDPRQVLSYLNQLGYTNIDANQLQAFITDLKKLVKYEERQTKLEPVIRVNVLTESSMDYKTPTSLLDKYGERELDAKNPSTNGVRSHSNISTNLLETENIPNREAENIPRQKTENIPSKKNFPERPSTAPLRFSSKESTKPSSQSSIFRSTTTIACPIHSITGPEKPRSKSSLTACTCPTKTKPKVRNSSMKNRPKKEEKERCMCETKQSYRYPDSNDNLSYFSDYYPARKQTKKSGVFKDVTQDYINSCRCPESSRPKSSVIKCNVGCRPTIKKCDPVNLHKFYQKQWQINPIPGENMQKDQRFRWCFREKISCGPPVKK